jgi:hypothetical protein
LFIIGMTRRRRLVAGLPPVPKRTRDEIASTVHFDVANDGGGELARGETVGMEPPQPLLRQTLHDLNGPLRGTAVGMTVRVEQGHQRFRRTDRRIVLVLPNRRHDLALARRNLVFGKRRLPHHLTEERQHRLEVFGEACADERQDVPRHGNRDGDAAVIELFGDIVRRSPLGAAIQHAGEQPGRAHRFVGIAQRTGPHPEADGNCWCRACLFPDEHHAVVEDRAGRSQTSTDC